MTAAQFIKSMEESYGNYTKGLKTVTEAWLGQCSEEYLEELYIAILETHSAQYKTPPGIPEFRGLSETIEDRLDSVRLKRKALMIHRENQALLAAPDEETVTIDGEKFTLVQALIHLVSKAVAQGRNPETDQEVLKFREKYVHE
jgi:hypothetical protein